MIIGIDGNEANQEKKVGIGQYAYELLLTIYKQRNSVDTFVVYLKNSPRTDLPESSSTWQYRVIGPKKLWTQFSLPLDLYTHAPRPEVFFTPSHYAPRFSPMPCVTAIMDVSYLHYPRLFKYTDLYQLKQWTGYSIKKAKKVFTISKASKSDIIAAYNVSEEKVVVTYPGIKGIVRTKSEKEDMEIIKKKHGIKGEYILFVGTLQPRKNLTRLIEAFSILKEKKDNKNVELVIVGKKGWLYEDILKAPSRFGVKDDVRFLDFIGDEELPSLYKNALFFILPSLYEGFGLPVLEAMANGCPVIVSNVSSLPEAAGEAALYVDPEKVEDIAEKMDSLLQNSSLREELVQKGLKQVKKFSWDKTARQTLEILHAMVDKQ